MSAPYSVAGTVFSDGKPRFIKIQEINFDVDIGRLMICIVNADILGIVVFVGNILGEYGINIAHFHLGRSQSTEHAISFLCIDGSILNSVLEKLSVNVTILFVKQFEFNVD